MDLQLSRGIFEKYLKKLRISRVNILRLPKKNFIFNEGDLKMAVFCVAQQVFERLPGICFGVLVAKGINNMA